MMLLEISLGQFMSRGGIEAWDIAPVLKGVGYSCLVLVMWINIYYIVILSWTLIYFLKSITGAMPWSTCGNTWNTECCSSEVNSTTGKLVTPDDCNGTVAFPENEYWYNEMLQLTDGFGEMGSLRPPIVGALVFLWFITFCCIFKGIKSTGKAAYVTATFPLVMLIILVVRGVSLDGAWIGISYFLKPDLTKLKNPEVWTQAGSQVLFSYVSGQGVLTSMGSYNKFSFNVFKWSTRLCLLNFCASMMAGLAIFSVLGNMCHLTGMKMEDVAQGGPGLAFMTYPRALSSLWCPQLWCALFFGMILMLGIATQVFNRRPNRRTAFVALVCLTCLSFALPMVTEGGMYLFQLCDSYGANGISLLTIVFFEAVAVAWVYGKDKFYQDMFNMYGHKMDPRRRPWTYFGFAWKWVTPPMILATLGYAFVAWSPPTYDRADGTYTYPTLGTIVAVLMTMSSGICVPIYFSIAFLRKYNKIRSVRETWSWIIEARLPSDHPYLQIHSEKKIVRDDE
ncbi:Oidioi.mRNA.OKI2018_I69.chr2.g6481.t2.cds [Oikopleura dioica]|nr:Oidioi.mRNA.OKI2018_I69.chr2.g6481.t2.cds [Oikopleura dioica]